MSPVYYDDTVQHENYFAMDTPNTHNKISWSQIRVEIVETTIQLHEEKKR